MSDMYERIMKVALPQIRCQLHDHAKQYDNDEACHNKRNGGKLHGNISRNCYGNAIIGRYGGCFEEAHHWNIQAKYYNEIFPLVYGSDNIRDSLS